MNNPPWHQNKKFSNKKVYWKSTDSVVTFKENLKIPQHQAYLETKGWSNNLNAIEYQYNSHGFRTAEFDQQKTAIALGCSFTEGIGLPVEQTWPVLLGEKISMPIFNLGVAGLSLDGCFRLFEYYITTLNVSTAFLLMPEIFRFELHKQHSIYSFLPGVEYNQSWESETFEKTWVLSDSNSYYNRKKNILSMLKLAEDAGINLFIRSLTDFHVQEYTRARDMLHDGYESHANLANLFYDDYVKNSIVDVNYILDK